MREFSAGHGGDSKDGTPPPGVFRPSSPGAAPALNGGNYRYAQTYCSP
ncbi:MAG TPA: hypothetical protein VL981_09070 [Candidatus Methylacidiphilales bacterium]|nr:hypothetical protein [Candidatus Methylacidiphilales bacterium]